MTLSLLEYTLSREMTWESQFPRNRLKNKCEKNICRPTIIFFFFNVIVSVLKLPLLTVFHKIKYSAILGHPGRTGLGEWETI